MRRLFGNIFLLLILTVSAAVPALAWDDVGHKITAYIAWQRMSRVARENVIKILRAAPEDSQLATFYMSYGAEPEETRKREFFMLTAIWADIVRDRDFKTRYAKYHKGNWHYSDTFWKQINGRVEELTGFPEGGLGVEKLIELDKVLRDPAASAGDKAIAIAWIMHIGGDLHQPLHTSARVTDLEPKGDQGGNLFLLSPVGAKREDRTNLHSYWDSITGRNIPLKGEQCERDYIEPIADKIMKKYPFEKIQTQLKLGQYGAWQKESFALNPTDVFSADLKRNEMPSDKYRKNAFDVAERQFAMAGYRLGETLNTIFGTMPVTPEIEK
ncbi:MAG: S1/P1 nuclease [Pyrinomonadaceae bacterium]